jgi:hypothetical protein
MATCPITWGKGKDTGANFVAQFRNASDITRMLRIQGTKRNYQVDSVQYGKGLNPIGGIPQSDLIALGHSVMAVGPSNVLVSQAGYIIPTCTPCGSTNFPPYSTLQASLSLIRY